MADREGIMGEHKRKRAILPITFELISFALSRPGEVVSCTDNDIPPDARVATSYYDILTDRLMLVLESESFPETAPREPLPFVRGPWFKVEWPDASGGVDELPVIVEMRNV